MKVLSLTHAHLDIDGLSPVSCERADSFTGTWTENLGWEVDVVYTEGTKWRGIWPGGKGLKNRIFTIKAPSGLIKEKNTTFAGQVKELYQEGNILGIISILKSRISYRVRLLLSQQGLIWPPLLNNGRKWGTYIFNKVCKEQKKYDFVFACVGYGDEYLLQTAYTLSQLLRIPMVVDFRDLWSEHHEPLRFTQKQRSLIRTWEKKLLRRTRLISVTQHNEQILMQGVFPAPVVHIPHSAYLDAKWDDGTIATEKLEVLYAGKLYPKGPGLRMLLGLILALSDSDIQMPFKFSFFVDDPILLEELCSNEKIRQHVCINDWISPQELWKKLRTAHVLIVTDLGLDNNHQIIPTKTIQFALTGREIIYLSQQKNELMENYLEEYDAGNVYYDIEDAKNRIIEISRHPERLDTLPPLRKVATRTEVAMNYALEIIKHIDH